MIGDHPPATVDEAIGRALAAYASLTELGEEIDDEWSYVNDLATAWRDQFEEVASARAGSTIGPAADAAIDRAIDEIERITDPHRAIDWLSTFPQVALLALGETPVRFQDAARDGRAVVYAGIQADPLVARAASLLADATPAQRVLARAVMNGETTDPAGWMAMFPSLFGDATGPERDRSSAVLAVSLEVADRGEQVRSQFRGAIVEEVTAVLLARRVGAAAVRRERRVLFDGVRSEIHPYDVTVEREGAAEAFDCKWGARGIGGDVLYQLDDARTHAVDEGERLAVALVVFDAERSCLVRLARQTAPVEGTTIISLESLERLFAAHPPR